MQGSSCNVDIEGFGIRYFYRTPLAVAVVAPYVIVGLDVSEGQCCPIKFLFHISIIISMSVQK